MVTTEKSRQGTRRRACHLCDGHGRVTMGWPENVSWDENASPCSPCAGRGWVADARSAARTSRRRIRP
jgi:DnaJ-class molecular chaperone